MREVCHGFYGSMDNQQESGTFFIDYPDEKGLFDYIDV
jgi:hypothetical protein